MQDYITHILLPFIMPYQRCPVERMSNILTALLCPQLLCPLLSPWHVKGFQVLRVNDSSGEWKIHHPTTNYHLDGNISTANLCCFHDLSYEPSGPPCDLALMIQGSCSIPRVFNRTRLSGTFEDQEDTDPSWLHKYKVVTFPCTHFSQGPVPPKHPFTT